LLRTAAINCLNTTTIPSSSAHRYRRIDMRTFFLAVFHTNTMHFIDFELAACKTLGIPGKQGCAALRACNRRASTEVHPTIAYSCQLTSVRQLQL
jgi:hypothetical protein